MPVLKVFYDETLESAARAGRSAIRTGLERMMRETLEADPLKCQIVLCPVLHASPVPVYADIQFRANAHRTRAVVAQAMRETAEVLRDTFGGGIRIRAFDIDQTGLHALDTTSPEPG